MLKFACSFTGHRPARFSFGYNENDKKCLKIKAIMSEWIDVLISGGIKTFYSGMALGVDQWAASIVLDKRKEQPGVRLIAVLPCETQANSWATGQRKRYYNILSECDDVIALNTHYTNSCMVERNRRLVDHAEYLLAVFDGAAKGGTSYTIRYAQTKQRQIITIHPDTLAVISSADIAALHRRSEMKLTRDND